MEQFVRDARIAMIYEGANGIQALDLVGRKLPKDGGRAVMAFFNEVGAFLKENAEDEALAPYLKPLKTGLEHLQQATMWFMQNAHGEARQCRRRLNRLHAPLRPRRARLHVGAGSPRRRSRSLPRARTAVRTSTQTRLTLGRFFMERTMPETAAHLARISSGADTMMALPAEAF